VRNPTEPLVDILVHRAAVESSPKLCRRVALPRRAMRCLRRVVAACAAVDGFAASRAPPRCFPCTKIEPLTRSRASPPPVTAARRRPLLLAAGRAHACVLNRWIQIGGPRSSRLRCLTRPPPAAIRSRSNGSDRVSRVNTGQTGRPLRFCRKPPVLSVFHKNTLPQ
jgi:hypothetical protein